jgi:hypothetical protein
LRDRGVVPTKYCPPRALADSHQILFTHHTTIKDPHPPCLAVFPFHGAKNRFDGRNIGAVSIKQFVAERETVLVTISANYQLLVP